MPDKKFVLGAFEHGQLIGTVGLSREDSHKFKHKGVIWGMYVAPEQRGQGVGRALLQTAITHARSIAHLEQLLLGVMATQVIARKLYASLGFVTWGIEPRAVKVDERYLDEEFMLLRLGEVREK